MSLGYVDSDVSGRLLGCDAMSLVKGNPAFRDWSSGK
jgi:hypothetical protein